MPHIIQITIYGPGCPSCRNLIRFVREVASDAKIPIAITQDDNFEAYIERGILRTPSLEINGEIKSSGPLPPRQKLKSWLKTAAQYSSVK